MMLISNSQISISIHTQCTKKTVHLLIFIYKNLVPTAVIWVCSKTMKQLNHSTFKFIKEKIMKSLVTITILASLFSRVTAFLLLFVQFCDFYTSIIYSHY